jgi:hypothetical protein
MALSEEEMAAARLLMDGAVKKLLRELGQMTYREEGSAPTCNHEPKTYDGQCIELGCPNLWPELAERYERFSVADQPFTMGSLEDFAKRMRKHGEHLMKEWPSHRRQPGMVVLNRMILYVTGSEGR